MSKPFDYSKWDRLELSDDEDTFHPNLDKNLNIRVNRITRDRKEEEIDAEKKRLEEAGLAEKAAKVESKRPLHVGNICRVAEERTIVNFSQGRSDRHKKDGEEFSIDSYMEFKTDNKQLLDEFTHADWEKSRQMLFQRGDVLLDECANNFFMLTALEEQMKGNTALVEKLGRQGQIISQIHQLAKPMNRPPRDLVHRFFDKFDNGDAKAAFHEGVEHFLGHIRRRAEEKKKEEAEEAAQAAQAAQAEEQGEAVSLVEAMYTMTPEERKGPGGLDPVEVFESLPTEMQECFKSGDVEMLKQVASSMDTAVFEQHFQRCIDSGLWRTG
jgi:cell division cycle protein 37